MAGLPSHVPDYAFAVFRLWTWRQPGAPIIRVDGQLVVGSVTKVFPATASVTMGSGYANGIVYYTLNGSAPTFGSAVFSAPVIVSNSVVVRALGLNVDTFDSAEAPAVTVNILPTYALTITTSGSGTVATVPSPGPYASNTVVSVTATPNSGWLFDHWTGDGSGNANPLRVTMDRSKLVQTVFVQLFPVAATTLGGGSVTVTPAQASYPSNMVVSVSATASSGWTFLRWSGDASGANNPLSLTVNAPKNVAAVFGTAVGTSVIGSGVIELNATNPIPYGTVVRATAIPNNGSYFTQWGSALTGTNSPTEFSVFSTNPVRAVFGTLQAGQAALSLRISGAGSVAVAPRQQVYTVGDTVTLTATPQGPTNQFIGWSGDASGTNNLLSVTMTTKRVVTASFSTIVAPVISTQPQSQTVAAGANVGFSVAAGNIPPLAYQWAFNGNNLPGATSFSLNLSNVQLSHAGYYQVRVTNVSGLALSAVANLSVIAPLTNGAGFIAAPVGLVDWWPAEGNANDMAGPNNGTPSNAVSYVPGRVGFAFRFDGSTSVITAGASDIPPPWTACFWVNRQNSSDPSAALTASSGYALKLEQYNLTRKVGITEFGVADHAFN